MHFVGRLWTRSGKRREGATFEVADYFGIDLTQARGIAAEVGKVVSGWRVEAGRFGLSRSEIDRMATAFEHDDLKTA